MEPECRRGDLNGWGEWGGGGGGRERERERRGEGVGEDQKNGERVKGGRGEGEWGGGGGEIIRKLKETTFPLP